MRTRIGCLLGVAIGLALSIICTPAVFAADMSVKAAPGSVVVTHNWTGFYIGGNVGYGWGRVANDIAFSQPLIAGGNAILAGSDSNNLNGVIGGAQLGYSWQINNYLLGIEADIQAAGQKNSATLNGGIDPVLITGNDATTITHTEKLEWLSTVRGRLGIVSGPWLGYATGGLAIGKVNTNGVFAPAPAAGITNGAGTWDESTTKTGWTIGVGIENAVSSNWSWKVEYLYVNLGNVTGSATLPATNCYGLGGICALTSGPGTATVTSKFTDNIVRVGLNYKFNN